MTHLIVRGCLVLALLLTALTTTIGAQNRYDPRLRFHTISTARFDIHFHQGEEKLARRLALVAEDVASKLDAQLGRPAGRTHVILVDQTDLSNGWATPVPYNLIEIAAAPPAPESVIGNTDDWLRLVFTHEYTHIVHLDRSRGLFGGLRRVFGRHAVLYPNLFLPPWQIEGIATHEETALTGSGRIAAGDFRMILERAAAAGRFAELDRATGGSVDWPGGNAPYLYGGYFHRYLAEKYGQESLERLSEETARRIPYLGSPAFKKVFGRPLGLLWDDFEAESRRRARSEEGQRTRLTVHGFTVSAPRYTPSGRLFYSVANPHGFPSLMELPGDGSSPRSVTSRYFGSALAPAGDWLVFDQLETVANVALQSDLYAVRQDGGGARRLTRYARAADPDVSPDGRTIVCTIQRTDSRGLATLPFRPDTITPPQEWLVEEGYDYSSPRWSPDGRSIVAERRRLGGASEIVLIEVATRQVQTLVSTNSGRNINPTWLPDGTWVLFASNSNDGPFTLQRVQVSSKETWTMSAAGTGAHSPTLSPDGRTLTFVGYSADGYDLYSIPFDDAVPTAAGARLLDEAQAAPAILPETQALIPPRPYRPWTTLLPTFWTPVVASDDDELVLGAGTGGLDALGRHSYGVAAGWSPSRARPDWNVTYAYDRWWPTLFVAASDDTDPFREGELRTREFEAGALLPFRRVRRAHAVLASLHGETDSLDCAACEPPAAGSATRRSLRFGWAFDGARRFGYSISDEEGVSVSIASEFTRKALGSEGDAGSVTLDARGFVRAFPRHGVAALRVAGGSAWGDDAVRRIFGAGGPGPQPGGLAYGLDAVGLLRGFDETDILGRHVAIANLDYRLPLLYVQRGFGTWPIFLRTLHASAFADVGNAWDAQFHARDLRRSFGFELSADTIVGHALPLTFTGGAAWRHGAADGQRGVVFFGRIGRAF